jgi:uncharacterized membrane protein YfcA
VFDALHSVWHALDVGTWQFVAAVMAASVGGVISGLTGFGFGLVVVPILLMLFPPASVVVLSKGLGVSSGFPILLEDWRLARFRMIGAMIVPAIPGLFAGVFILQHANSALIKLIAGVAVAGFAVVISRGFIIPGIQNRIAPVVSGFLSGTLGTSTGMPGPPAVIYLTDKRLTPRVFRVSITAYFFVVDIIGVLLVIRTGKVGWRELWVALVLLPFALVGRRIGRRLLTVIDPETFRRITLRLLIATGAAAVITALLSLR